MLVRSRTILALVFASAAGLAINAPATAQAKKDGTVAKAKSQAPSAPNPAPSAKQPDPAMENLLLEWEKKSSQITSLSVKYKRTDVSALFGRETYYEGQARLKSPNLAYLDFYEIKPATVPATGKAAANAAPVFDERIVCNGKKVYQFKGPTRQVFIHPLAKDQRQKALEEGPLPFLFNMKASKAKERYEMALVNQDNVKYFIRIVPKLKIDADEYSYADVLLDKKQLLPMAIKLWAPSGKDYKLFTFDPKDLVANKEIADKYFDGNDMIYGPAGVTKLAKPWAVVDNPSATMNPNGAENPAPAGRVGAAPAPKNAGDRRK